MRRMGVELRDKRETSPSSACQEISSSSSSSLSFRDFHFRGCTLTGGNSWKTITYRWLWIFRDSGSALFRSRECYGAEFLTVLFPLRHVPPLLPFAVSRRRDREEKEQTRLRAPSPGWSFSCDFLACLPGHEWDRATEAKIQEPNRAEDVNFLALSSLMGFSSPLSLFRAWSFSSTFSFLKCLSSVAILAAIRCGHIRGSRRSVIPNSEKIRKVIVRFTESYNCRIAQISILWYGGYFA